MIIVDTSVWVEHIRGRSTPLEPVLGAGEIAIHPFVLGELLLNGLPPRGEFSAEGFARYAAAPVASSLEVATIIREAKLAGTGLGYVDAHLLVSAKITPRGALMTLDGALRAQAERMGVAA